MARDYGRIHTAYWSHPKIRACGDRAKLLGCYLVTGPHSNAVGAYLLPDAYVADDLGWPIEAVSKAFAELFAIGFVERFRDGRHIVICDYLDWNPVENPNVAKGITKQINQLPDDPAIRHILNGLQQYAKHFTGGLKTVFKPFRNMEPNLTEPEMEPEPEMDKTAPQADAVAQSPVVIVTPSNHEPTKARKTALPDNFPFQDDIAQALKFWLANGRGDLSAMLEYDKFRAHHTAHGSRMASWPAAWRTWFHNALKFNKREHGNGAGRQGPSENKHLRAAVRFAGAAGQNPPGENRGGSGLATGAGTERRSLQSPTPESDDHEDATSRASRGDGRDLPTAEQHDGGRADDEVRTLFRHVAGPFER